MPGELQHCVSLHHDLPALFQGPAPTWLIGNLGSIVAMGFPFYMEKLAAQYGPVFKVRRVLV